MIADSGMLTRKLASQGARSDVALRRSEEHTSELQSRLHLVCRLLLEKKIQAADHVEHVRGDRPVRHRAPRGRHPPERLLDAAPSPRSARPLHPPQAPAARAAPPVALL